MEIFHLRQRPSDLRSLPSQAAVFYSLTISSALSLLHQAVVESEFLLDNGDEGEGGEEEAGHGSAVQF